MNTKHTQGPWIYAMQGFKISIGNAKTANTTTAHEYQVCVIEDNSLQAEANARLIAAAPDMLKALIEAKKLIEIARQYMPKSIKNADKFTFENISANCINKAIDKATI